jgi:hypothetical protein
MYLVSVILLLLVLPVISIVIEAAGFPNGASTIFLIGRWFVFWAVGVRLFIAGVRQTIQPQFTATEIFGTRDLGSLPIVREVGFANLSMGFLGICSVFHADWILPGAIVGGLYYGLAGLGHAFKKEKNTKERIAMISDVFIFVLLAWFVLRSLESHIA